MQRIAVLSVLALLGCNPHPVRGVSPKSTANVDTTVEVNPNRKVDILFVIDNSGSMAEEQATLAANFGAFVDVLEDPLVDADYRIAITTTDAGTCDGGVQPGALHLTPCESRPEAFVFAAATDEARDEFEVACAEPCELPAEALAVLPSLGFEDDADLAPRPWLERVGGLSNLPAGTGVAEAFACLAPQGIDGCGYEAPLETMLQGLRAAEGTTGPSAGFLRPDALLAVVFVTDEADCSLRPEHEALFEDDENDALWAEGATGPTSAICWNAGVRCQEGPDGLDCQPALVGPDGEETTEDGAVLHPLRRYIDYVERIAEEKREHRSDAGVLVSVIGGVPEAFPEVPLSYARGVDPAFELDFGIAPGCTSTNGTAVPPVRLAAFADHFTPEGEEPPLYSVCSADYTVALDRLAGELIERLEPACADECPADEDPITPGLQPSCVLRENAPDGSVRPLSWCDVGADGQPILPAGSDLCVAIKTGSARDARCIERDLPVEYQVVRRPGVPRLPGAAIEANCLLSPAEGRDCGM